MRLLMTPTSPFARKVRMFAQEKGIDLPIEDTPPHAPGSPVPAANPLVQVPTLLLDDGQAVFDSRVIVTYLDLLAPEPVLLPADAQARIAVLQWEALADGIADATVLWMLEQRRTPPEPAWTRRQVVKIEGGLAVAERAVQASPFLVGDRLTLADLALVAAIGYVALRRPVDLAAWPALQTWYARLHDRPSVRDTAAPD
jgi:glutathione S-transferase